MGGGGCPRIHAKAYVKFALKVKNTPGTYLTHSGFAEIGRAAEGSTDPDLHDAAMKPGNKETKQETQARRPLRRVGAKAYSKGKEAQEERQEGRKVGGQVRESAPGAQTPQDRDRAGHRDEAVRLLAPGDGVRTVLRARLAQGRRPQTRPVKVAATQAAEEGAHGPARRADPVRCVQGGLRALLGGFDPPPVQQARPGWPRRGGGLHTPAPNTKSAPRFRRRTLPWVTAWYWPAPRACPKRRNSALMCPNMEEG